MRREGEIGVDGEKVERGRGGDDVRERVSRRLRLKGVMKHVIC